MIILNVEHIKPLEINETIVMVHGLQSSLRTFDITVQNLPANYEVFRVDQRGHGNSPASGESYTSEEMAKDLHKVIHSSNISIPFHLLGHSMGGRTALAYAGLYPEDLKGIIIEDMGMEQRATLDENKLNRLKKLYAQYKDHQLIFDTKEEIEGILKPLFSYYKGLMESKVTELENGQFKLEFNPGVAALYGYQGNYSDLSWGLENEIPVSFFVADPEIGSAMNQRSIKIIEEKFPRAKIIYFPKAWHNIHKSQPVKFVEELIKSIKNSGHYFLSK